MRYQPKRQRDRQRTAPVHQCAQCGGELYPGGAYWKVNGRIFCESCLVAWTPLSRVVSSGFSIILCTLLAAGAGAWLFPREEVGKDA